jgi:hypothetical protein
VITILEGPDGGGKTTLTPFLIKHGYADAIDNHGPYPREMSIAPRYFASVRKGLRGNVVCDRAWQAEPIYGAAFRDGADRIGVAYRRMLERVALSAQAVVVYCLPPRDRCLSAWRERRGKEYLQTEKQLRAVYRGYQRAAIREVLPHFTYDYTASRPGVVVKQLAALRSPRNQGPGIGAWRPGEVIVLVGDISNASIAEIPDLPFVNFSRKGCSAWLAEDLEACGVPETRLYWINARLPNGAPTSARFLERLRPLSVIALGGNAAAWCATHRVDHVRVDHPQHHKRFHHRRPYPLGATIREYLK